MGSDLRHPNLTHLQTPVSRFINWYIGKVHRAGATDPNVACAFLRVANLAEAESFYASVLGFDIIARYESQALFVSAGGYHGHVGLNTWDGVDAPPPPSGSIGLRYFDVRLPNTVELDRVTKQVRDAGVTLEETPAGVLVHDPSAHALLLTTSAREIARTRLVERKEEGRNIS